MAFSLRGSLRAQSQNVVAPRSWYVPMIAPEIIKSNSLSNQSLSHFSHKLSLISLVLTSNMFLLHCCLLHVYGLPEASFLKANVLHLIFTSIFLLHPGYSEFVLVSSFSVLKRYKEEWPMNPYHRNRRCILTPWWKARNSASLVLWSHSTPTSPFTTALKIISSERNVPHKGNHKQNWNHHWQLYYTTPKVYVPTKSLHELIIMREKNQ